MMKKSIKKIMVVLSSFFLVACGTEPPAIRFDEVTIAEEKANHIADLFFEYITFEDELGDILIRQKKGKYKDCIFLEIYAYRKDGRGFPTVMVPLYVDGILFDYHTEGSANFYAYNEKTDEFGSIYWAYKSNYITKEDIEEYKVNNNVTELGSEGPSLK